MPTVAILAGGLGTRLRPATNHVPKAMIEISGEPFIAHQIRLLKRAGFSRLVLCVGYLGDMIRMFVGNGGKFGVEVEYSSDYPELRGTAGAIRNALPLLGERFVVLYGDSYLPCDYGSIVHTFLADGPRGLMTVYRNRDRWGKSNVIFRAGRIIAYDKVTSAPEMEYIDYGISAFHRSVFAAMRVSETKDLASIYQSLIPAGELAGFEAPSRFFEVGSWEGIRSLESYLRMQGSDATVASTVP